MIAFEYLTRFFVSPADHPRNTTAIFGLSFMLHLHLFLSVKVITGNFFIRAESPWHDPEWIPCVLLGVLLAVTYVPAISLTLVDFFYK